MSQIYRLKKFFISKPYTKREELMHILTHGIGAVVVSLVSGCLITLAALTGNTVKIVSISIFCASVVILYCASTLYHLAENPKAKRRLKVLDHASIYLLIAGTYTPFLLVNLAGPVGTAMFIIVWTMALLGITAKIFFIQKFKKISVAVYLVMGWMIIFAIKPMIENINPTGLTFMAAGGLLYSCGVYFYIRKDKEFYHGIWHIFVLIATLLHFFAVLYGVVMSGTAAF